MKTDYAQMAREHLQRHRPHQYAELISEPEAATRYFDEISQRAAAMVQRVEAQTLASLPPSNPHDPAALSARAARATAIAQELVLTELILAPDGDTEPRTDQDGAYLGWDPGTEPLLSDSTRLLH